MTRQEYGRYVSTHYDRLCRFVHSRVPHPHDAEDILQQALMRLLLQCDGIDAASPDPFIFTALRNAIIDFWRQRGQRQPPGPLPEQLADERMSPEPAEGAAVEARCRDLVREAAGGLTPRERQAFVVYWRHRGDRAAALDELVLTAAGKDGKYRVYDGPLFHARRKLAAALAPGADLLTSVGYDRAWELIAEVLGVAPPGAAP
jgi:RNA polymerase sigma factor (sigma-70 family)